MSDTVIPLGAFLITLISVYYLRKLFFNRLRFLGKRTRRQFVESIIDTIDGPSFIWLLMLAIYLSLEIFKLPENIVGIAGKILLVLSIASITLVVSNVAVTYIRFQARRTKTVIGFSSD
ncbi:hypothetical protein ACFLU1_06510 [Chloroflexota bacterium]